MSKMQNRIFSMDSAKAIKARGFGYLNAIHYMAPHSLSGVNLCSHSSAACIALCLGWHSGQASMVANESDINSVRKSRIDKAQRFMRDRVGYMKDFVRSIELALRAAKRLRLKLCVRPNGATDIAFEGIKCVRNGIEYANVMLAFPEVQFVDYTKNPARMLRNLPVNYSLTLSRHESNDAAVIATVKCGRNAAVVFDKLPESMTWNGLRVIDGDKHDLRHLDPRGVIVGLIPKGNKAKRDQTGFVVRNAA